MGGNSHWGRQASNILGEALDRSADDRARHAGRAQAEKRIERERIEADAEATRYLAEMNCPADLIEWGKNNGIPAFAEVTWTHGFMAGWRMACARQIATDARKEGGL
jgi:hypothetical protein